MSNTSDATKRLAVIRIRSLLGRQKEIKKTVELLRLHHTNHCTIIDDRETYRGMLQKSKDVITWGEIDATAAKALIMKRGRLPGGKKLTNDYIRENSTFSDIDDFVKKFLKFEADLSDIEGLKPVFRLSPPRKGLHGAKKSFTLGGALGYRGEAINELLARMA